MTQSYTHYHNLKVARNAPPEVIRAAYKTLSQKYHPDRNPGDAEAARITVIINASYAVLSDPVKRRDHDIWIAEKERIATQSTAPVSQHLRQTAKSQTQKTKDTGPKSSAIGHVLRHWIYYGTAALVIWLWAIAETSPPASKSAPHEESSSQGRFEYVRPSTAPNGTPWPASSGYIKGYKRLHVDGLSTVTVDNSKNDSDVFVKLVSVSRTRTYPVRQFYIPAYGRFTLNKISAGSYDIRYRDLGSGRLSRSESFRIDEIRAPYGTQYSSITMTLYKVQNGNMQSYGLSEAEF